ncbi:hypothetical protein BaRGS_00028174 [Batillaria attramentaria]|uniref:Kazal-like domain-containing protein n=1 Tax=Batillaria attramentaria TaxID=370345 RepID=A0ABD0K179_9CAEN
MATKESLLHRLTVHYTTSSSGYVTTPGFDGMRILPSIMNATYHLILPKHHVGMLSVRFQSTRFHIRFQGAVGKIFKTFYLPRVFKSSLVITASYDKLVEIPRGFKLLFSFHPVTKAPLFKMENAFTPIFDCSGPRYASFKQHLHCNLDTECQHGEDEGEHCSFSPPGCDGHVGYQNKCFVLMKGYQQLGTGTDKLCENVSGTLA